MRITAPTQIVETVAAYWSDGGDPTETYKEPKRPWPYVTSSDPSGKFEVVIQTKAIPVNISIQSYTEIDANGYPVGEGEGVDYSCEITYVRTEATVIPETCQYFREVDGIHIIIFPNSAYRNLVINAGWYGQLDLDGALIAESVNASWAVSTNFHM